jgi:Fe2+ or Zn2+ uptake regulation protein
VLDLYHSMSERIAGLKHQTAYRIIALLKEEKILSTIVKASGRTPEVLVFDDLFELIR